MLTPRDAERRLEAAFAAQGLPVAEHAVNGRVTTGRFRPHDVWPGALTSRVTCSGSDGTAPPASIEWVEVVATVREAASRGTRVEVESYGRGRDGKGRSVSCRLDEGTMEALLSVVPRYERR